jgi:predicted negative regulator of RcsB-dependent stress response
MIIEHLGDVYLTSGKKDKAKAQYERALKIDPEQKKIKEKLENLKLQK